MITGLPKVLEPLDQGPERRQEEAAQLQGRHQQGLRAAPIVGNREGVDTAQGDRVGRHAEGPLGVSVAHHINQLGIVVNAHRERGQVHQIPIHHGERPQQAGHDRHVVRIGRKALADIAQPMRGSHPRHRIPLPIGTRLDRRIDLGHDRPAVLDIRDAPLVLVLGPQRVWFVLGAAEAVDGNPQAVQPELVRKLDLRGPIVHFRGTAQQLLLQFEAEEVIAHRHAVRGAAGQCGEESFARRHQAS